MSRVSRRLAVSVLGVVATLAAVASSAGAVTITEYPISGLKVGETEPRYIASSPTGRLWFTDIGTSHGVRQMDTTGHIVGGYISAPPGASAPTGDLAFGPEGALTWAVDEAGLDPRPYWVTRAANGTVEPDGPWEGVRDGYAIADLGDTLYVTMRRITEGNTDGYQVCSYADLGGVHCFGNDTIDSRLTDLTLDQSGRLWALQPEGDAIRRSNAARTAFDLTVPLPGGSRPGRAALGPDGNIWVAGFGNKFGPSNTTNQVIRVTPEGVTTSFGVPPGRGVNDIAAGPDGALWFTELLSGSIGRITTCGEYTSYPLPNPGATPYGIVAGADGALWFTEAGNAAIGRLAPDPPAGDCPTPPPAVDTTAPSLGKLRLSRPAFRAATSGASTSRSHGAPLGTKVSLDLSEPSNVAFTVDRRSTGRSAGGRCVKQTPSNAGHKRCTRWIKTSGSFAIDGGAGTNTFTFRGLVGGKPLHPGGYRLNGQAKDAAKNASEIQRKSFTILP